MAHLFFSTIITAIHHLFKRESWFVIIPKFLQVSRQNRFNEVATHQSCCVNIHVCYTEHEEWVFFADFLHSWALRDTQALSNIGWALRGRLHTEPRRVESFHHVISNKFLSLILDKLVEFCQNVLEFFSMRNIVIQNVALVSIKQTSHISVRSKNFIVLIEIFLRVIKRDIFRIEGNKIMWDI